MHVENIVAEKIAHMKTDAKQTARSIKEMKANLIAEAEDRSSVINDVQSFLSASNQLWEQDRALIDSIRQAWGLTDRDNVQVFVVPPGQLSRMPFTSFVTRPTTSPRLQQLTINVTASMGRISELERGLGDPSLTDAERARRIAGLEESLSRYKREVARERNRLANGPRSGIILVERGEDNPPE